MRLLLVEDDEILGDGLVAGLKMEGYAVDWLTNGRLADEALKTNTYELIVLDWNLPDMDGMSILRALRSRKNETPVMVLTAKDTIPDRVMGLDTGADDFVIKPFELDEVCARLRALARRNEGRSVPNIEHKGTETFSWNTAGCSVDPAPGVPTFTKTVDTGAVGSATNQENAIVIYANTSSGGTTALVGDIIKQSGSRRYRVKTADGVKNCLLGTDDTPAPRGAYIVATSTGGTYYVTKLTAHRATLVTKTGDGALNGQQVQWSFAAPSGARVQIENA